MTTFIERVAMTAERLFFLLQLSGGTFPAGGFSQSWGLETFVSDGRVTSAGDCREFLLSYLEAVLASCEGPILREAVRYSAERNFSKLSELEELSIATKLTRENRESALRSGKALLRIAAEILNDRDLSEFYDAYRISGATNAVAFGAICGRVGISPDQAICAYVFNTVNGIVQSAVKLIPLGNTEAQRLLIALQPHMAKCVEMSMALEISSVTNFSPGLDLACISHETLPVRLYMS